MKSIVLVIFLCSLTAASGQSRVAVPLNNVTENVGITTMTSLFEKDDVMNDPSVVYGGIPQDMRTYIIKTLDLQPEQGVYELYLRMKGKMPVEVLKQGLRPYNMNLEDTVRLSRIPVKHYLSFLAGKNKEGQVVIIGDSNNNHDFGDDKMFLFDSCVASSTQVGQALFHFQYTDKGEVFESAMSLGMSAQNASIQYVNPVEQEHFLVVSLYEYKEGFLQAGDSSVKVKLILSRFPAANYNESNTRIYFDANEVDQYYQVGDSVQLNGRNYVLERLAGGGDTLYLSAFDGGCLYGAYPGAYAHPVSGVDIVTGDTFTSQNAGRKFILLDFWGSWCKPCIEAIPELVKFSEKYKDRLIIVSIAEDDPGRISLIKEMINAKRMTWTHLFEDIQNTSGSTFAKRYKIESYPTQILINPDGKIVYRSTMGSKLNQGELDTLMGNDGK